MKIDGITLLQIIKDNKLKDNTKIDVSYLDAPINYVIAKLTYKDNELNWEPGTFRVSMLYDDYYTFESLYFQRLILFATICKKNKDKAYRSKLHADGTMFTDYFIVGIETPRGNYTYHYHKQYWGYFKDIKILDKAPEWDGHTEQDVTRLLDL